MDGNGCDWGVLFMFSFLVDCCQETDKIGVCPDGFILVFLVDAERNFVLPKQGGFTREAESRA